MSSARLRHAVVSLAVVGACASVGRPPAAEPRDPRAASVECRDGGRGDRAAAAVVAALLSVPVLGVAGLLLRLGGRGGLGRAIAIGGPVAAAVLAYAPWEDRPCRPAAAVPRPATPGANGRDSAGSARPDSARPPAVQLPAPDVTPPPGTRVYVGAALGGAARATPRPLTARR